MLFGGKETFQINPSELSSESISQSITASPSRDYKQSFSSNKTVVQSGPNSPTQMAPQDVVAVVHSQPQSNDPLYNSNEPTNVSENITYPERFYRKAPTPDNTKISQEAGLTGDSDQSSLQNYQRYNTDFIQNSGEFMNGVYANDTQTPTDFSSY